MWGRVICGVGLSLLPSLARAQGMTDAKIAKPSDTLPTLSASFGRSNTRLTPNGTVEFFEKGGKIDWGILHITADEGEWHQTEQWVELRGHVVVIRGKETIRGEIVRLDLLKGIFTATHGLLQFENFTVAGDAITRDLKTGVITGKKMRLDAPRPSHSDLGFLTDDAHIDGQYLRLKNAQIRLFNKPLLTLKNYVGPIPSSTNLENSSTGIPLIVQFSQVSGFSYGVRRPYDFHALGTSHRLSVLWEHSTRRGVQQSYSLYSNIPLPPSKKAAVATAPPPLPGEQSPPLGEQSPLVTPPIKPATTESFLPYLLSEQPRPPVDTVATFRTILRTPVLIGRRQAALAPYLGTEIRQDENREFGERRAGNLFLSRRPETTLHAGVPASQNKHLKRLAPMLNFQYQGGDYAERRVNDSVPYATTRRTMMHLDLDTNSTQIAPHVLIHPRITQTWNRYNNSPPFQITEGALATEWVFGEQSGLTLAAVARKTHGQSPLFFDRIDAASEGQSRLQWQRDRVTFAQVTRWDLRQHKSFDSEWGIQYRGAVFAPRLSYRKQTGQISFTLTFNPRLFQAFEGINPK